MTFLRDRAANGGETSAVDDSSAATPAFAQRMSGRDEDVVAPDISIVDSHHHLHLEPGARYALSDYVDDLAAGHEVVASVYVETRTMLRSDGPEMMRPLGEVEFANDMAAMSASGAYGPARVAAGIVGHADLTLGSEVAELLDAAQAVSDGRFRGVRQISCEHPDPG